MRKWRIEDSEELYNITGWGVSYFGINESYRENLELFRTGIEGVWL